jgi:hypothetical protein
VTTALDLVTARARAESLMTSTCSIAPRGAEPVTDPGTGEVTFPPGVAVYTGKCRVRPSGQGSTSEAGGAEVFVYDYILDVPFSATGIRSGHKATISASPDPDAVGLQLEVARPYPGDQIVRRRLFCNEVS